MSISKPQLTQAAIEAAMDGRLYDCRDLVLLYPHHAALAGQSFPRAFRVNNSEDRLSVATLDVAQNEASILAALSTIIAEPNSTRRVA